jgi:transcriptional regulator with XRE-family HTH domain
MDSTTRQIVAANVKRLRLARGLSQTALGEKSGTGQTTVSSVERSDGKSPTLETLALLAKTLDALASNNPDEEEGGIFNPEAAPVI